MYDFTAFKSRASEVQCVSHSWSQALEDWWRYGHLPMALHSTGDPLCCYQLCHCQLLPLALFPCTLLVWIHFTQSLLWLPPGWTQSLQQSPTAQVNSLRPGHPAIRCPVTHSKTSAALGSIRQSCCTVCENSRQVLTGSVASIQWWMDVCHTPWQGLSRAFRLFLASALSQYSVPGPSGIPDSGNLADSFTPTALTLQFLAILFSWPNWHTLVNFTVFTLKWYKMFTSLVPWIITCKVLTVLRMFCLTSCKCSEASSACLWYPFLSLPFHTS